MKEILAILIVGLIWGANAHAKIDWQSRNLCENSKNKKICSLIINKKLVGINTIANFKFDKGKIIALIIVSQGENISLLPDPDPSYIAKYTGEYLVYSNAGGVSITEFLPTYPMEHLICNNANECTNSKRIKP